MSRELRRWRSAAVRAMGLVAAMLALVSGPAGSQGAAGTAAPSGDPRRSGFADMSAPIQAMQRDDSQNPGLLWVADGEAAWRARPAAGDARSCEGCHGAAGAALRGVAVRYPAWDARLRRPVTLQQRINDCRERHQSLPPLGGESDALLGLESFVAHQSRGLPIAPPDDARLAPWREQGAALFAQRIGQLNLSCAQCHDERAGLRLGGSVIPQGHPTGYPIYRLEWQGLGSLQRRLRNCTVGVRAEPYGAGTAEAVQLELHLAWRARGMTLETPAIRP